MKILVYPCSTEIAFEIYRALSKVKNIEIYGGLSDFNNHGEYVFKNIISKLPFISDKSDRSDIEMFANIIEPYNFDFLYPAMDGVVDKFSQFRDALNPIVISPDGNTASITRSKHKTYEVLKNTVSVPKEYSLNDVKDFPVFVKPDVGQGSVGAKKIDSMNELQGYLSDKENMLVLEYLPGEEYTVDCFTNLEGKLVSVCPRKRNRMKNGISVNSTAFTDVKLNDIAEKINSKIHNKGGWFFQVKKNSSGEYVLLEVASRIAGTSSFTRSLGVNLPLLTVYTYAGQNIDFVPQIAWKDISLDRALYNAYKTELDYNTVYVDYDDTIVVNGRLNIQLITFLYQCIDKEKSIYLISRHDDEELGKLDDLLEKYRIANIFDDVFHINREDDKYKYINNPKAIYIDDSYKEREDVYKHLEIPCFDPSMIEPLLDMEQIV